jgi:hypothetical protein
VALVQRSCGYALRPTLTLEEIGRAVAAIKAQNPDVIVAVDNCYGEFTDTREPPAVSRGCTTPGDWTLEGCCVRLRSGLQPRLALARRLACPALPSALALAVGLQPGGLEASVPDYDSQSSSPAP